MKNSRFPMNNASMLISVMLVAVLAAHPAARAAGEETPPSGVVLYDQKFSSSMVPQGVQKEIRDFLTAFGFECMHTGQVLEWMERQESRGAAGSLLVMNTDNMPAWLAGEKPGAPSPFRKYLESGGTVLWYGNYPGRYVSYQLEPRETWGPEGSEGLIGLDASGVYEKKGAAAPTGAGREFGLARSWNSEMPVDPANVTTVLAETTSGFASSWTKQFAPGSPGFVRIWDTSLTRFSADMAAELFHVVSALLPEWGGRTTAARVYTFKPSDYYRLWHRDGDSVAREIRVSYFNEEMPADAKYELVISAQGKELERISLAGGAPFFIEEMRVPVLNGWQEMRLVEITPGGNREIAAAKLDDEDFFTRAEFSASPVINYADLGYTLVPTDKMIVTRSQEIHADIWFMLTFETDFPAAASLTVENREGKTFARDSGYYDLTKQGIHEDRLSVDCSEIPPGVYKLTYSFAVAETRLHSESRMLVVLDKKPANRGFGAYYSELDFPGDVNVFDYNTKEWTGISWNRAWERGPHDDIVVSFPNGNRFLFWRGSGYVPFWYSHANSGMTYEWLEAGQVRGTLYDAVEPLQDKECRYSRAYIVSSTPARAVVRWRYALIGMRYGIRNDEWAEETFTFYPDGFGVRKAEGYLEPLAWTESSEFINLFPPGINPFDVYPPEMFRIMSPDGGKETTVTYPRARGTWDEGQPAVFRVNYNRRDDNTPVLAFHKFESFGSFFDGWKVDGRYISPNYWGVHFPVQRGYPTTRQEPPGWRDRAGHASLSPIAAEPLEKKMVHGKLERKTWAWLIGNTNLDDEYVLSAARSWLEPPKIKILGGATGGGYDTYQRGYVMESDGGDVIKLKFTGKGDEQVFNPVFIVKNWPYPSAYLEINGDPATEYKAGIETSYEKNTLVIWVGANVPRDAEISIVR